MNAQTSLRRPPKTGVQHLVVNLHWSTASVNHIVDRYKDLPQSLVVSKVRDFLYDDEETLQSFLSVTEDRKEGKF